jgi:hypothetical protein
MDSRRFEPFNDPKVIHTKQTIANAAFKAFNAVACRLLSELIRLYPSEAMIRMMLKELMELKESRDSKKWKMPATIFFKQIRQKVPMSDQEVEYCDILLRHDETALRDDMPIKILSIVGLKSKYQEMSEENRKNVWQFIDRLIELSAKAVFSNSDNIDDMNNMSRAILAAASQGKRDLTSIATDPGVEKSTQQFISATSK